MEVTVRENLLSLPEAFVQRMKNLLGEEYKEFEESYRKPRVQGLRLNGLKGNPARLEKDCRAYFALEPVLWAKYGFYYGKDDRPGKHPYHEAGLYYIQEPSAMAVVEALEVIPGDTVLDLCAAPGGKSTQIASALRGEGFFLSNEIHPARAKILSQNIERMGAANGIVTNHDAPTLARWLPEFFTKIVVDAPCSGEGMFRKEPEARGEWTPDSPRRCSLRQREILDSAAVMLKPGGRMVYSTCTFAPEENEEIIEVFLRKHPEFSLEQPKNASCFGKGRPEWASMGGRKELENTCRLWPHQIEGEGHYLAVLRKAALNEEAAEKDQGAGVGTAEGNKTAEEKTAGRKEARKKKKEKPSGTAGNPAVKNKESEALFCQFCREVFCTGNWEKPGKFMLFGEQLYYAPPELPDITGKKVLRPGLHLGTVKKNRFIPSHALALWVDREQVKHAVNLDSRGEQVVRYLKGESLLMDDAASGWVLVTVDGYSLGWGKMAGGRLQNHYPKGLRRL